MRRSLVGALVALLCATVSAQAQPKDKAPPPPAPTPTPTPQPEPPESESKEEPPKQEPPPPDEGADADDVDALRQEYLKLRDELYQSRARAATVASALYSTKVTVRLSYGSARFYTVDRAVIRLDGASVYDDTEGAIASDDAVRFEGWIAPGRHVLSIRVEATGKDDERFTSATETSFVVQAVGGKDLLIVAKAKDGGDIPYQWKKGEHGSYNLSISADVKTVKRADGGGAKEKKKSAKAPAKRNKKAKRRAAQK
jgi:hypothetical protein